MIYFDVNRFIRMLQFTTLYNLFIIIHLSNEVFFDNAQDNSTAPSLTTDVIANTTTESSSIYTQTQYETFTQTTETIEKNANQSTDGCEPLEADLIFIVDGSTSLSILDFYYVKTFVHHFIEESSFNSGKVRIGLVTYGSIVSIEFHLNTYTNASDVMLAINNVRQPKGDTNTADALMVMRETMFTPEHGDRPDVPNVAFLITDGKSTFNARRTIPDAEAARALGIHLYTFGVGYKIDAREIAGIASVPAILNSFIINNYIRVVHLGILELSINHCQKVSDISKTYGNRSCSDVESFNCNDGQCIHYQLICDGKRHCKNGFDENNCDNVVMESCKYGKSILRTRTLHERKINQNVCFSLTLKKGPNSCFERNGTQLAISSVAMDEIVTHYVIELFSLGISTEIELGLVMSELNYTHADYMWDGSPLTYTAWYSEEYSREKCFYILYSVDTNKTSWQTKSCMTDPWIFCIWRSPQKIQSIVSDVVPTVTDDWHRWTTFLCGSGEVISVLRVCDIVQDCLDNSDEEKCNKTFDSGIYSSCEDGTNINLGLWCDIKPDCPDESDERNCVHVPCLESEWRCDSGQCVPLAVLCDNTFDCYDRSDEANSACYGSCEERELFSCDEYTSAQCIPRTLGIDDHNDCENQGDKVESHTQIEPICNEATMKLTFVDFGDEVHGTLEVNCQTLASTNVNFLSLASTISYEADMDISIISIRFGSDFLADKIFYFYEYCYQEQMNGFIYSSNERVLPETWSENISLEGSSIQVEKRIDSPQRTLVYKGRVSSVDFTGNLECSTSNISSDPKYKQRRETLLSLERMACKTNKHTTIYARNKCLLNIKPDGTPFGCRDLTHLDNCETFLCPPGYLKCPDSFCLNTRLICDGQPHCPRGEDESGCYNHTCKGMYKCGYSSICLPQNLVCDNIRHCPLSDDEINCGYQCPSQCVCHSLSTRCYTTIIPAVEMSAISKQVRYLDFSNTKSSVGVNFPVPLPRLLVLNLSNCDIQNMISTLNQSPFELMNNLRILDLSHNTIKHISRLTFKDLNGLNELYLQGNKELDSIDDHAFNHFKQITFLNLALCGLKDIKSILFSGLSTLKYIDLRSNLLHLQIGIFNGVPNLGYLDIRGVAVTVDKALFIGVTNLRKLSTDYTALCCLTNELYNSLECIAPESYISSCSDLINNDLLRLCIWVIGSLALLGNIFVTFYRLKNGCCGGSWKTYTIFVTFLSISDFVMGIYTFTIASVDMYYRGVYVQYESQWRTSSLCTFAGILSTISCEASAMLICFIALDRYLAIRFPFSRITVKLSVLLSVLSMSIALMISIIPVMIHNYFGNQFYSRSGVCIALPLTTRRAKGWEYAVGVFILFNMVIFMIAAVAQIMLYRAVKESSLKSKRKVAGVDTAVAKSLTTVVVTDFCCWFPIGMLGFMSLDGYELSHDIYAWIIVFILPINSALNPILYTMSSIRKSKKRIGLIHSAKSVCEQGNEMLKIHHRINRCGTVMDESRTSLSQFLNENHMTPQLLQLFKRQLTDDIDFFHDKRFYHGHISEETVSVIKEGNEVVDAFLRFQHEKITEKMDEHRDTADLEALLKRLKQRIRNEDEDDVNDLVCTTTQKI